MIGFLRGELDSFFDDRIILDVNGMGFNVFMPSSQIATFSRTGIEVKIYTYMSVREDAMNLYGFLTADDLNLFKMLIGVSGVGPKFALGLLSTFTANDLKMSILSMDSKTISKSPGIGIKSAQKIILELKDKISLDEVINNSLNINSASDKTQNATMTEAMQDAIDALIALGYSSTDSLRAVRECSQETEDDVELILKKALKHIKR